MSFCMGRVKSFTNILISRTISILSMNVRILTKSIIRPTVLVLVHFSVDNEKNTIFFNWVPNLHIVEQISLTVLVTSPVLGVVQVM